jgi:hypothetical protein
MAAPDTLIRLRLENQHEVIASTANLGILSKPGSGQTHPRLQHFHAGGNGYASRVSIIQQQPLGPHCYYYITV